MVACARDGSVRLEAPAGVGPPAHRGLDPAALAGAARLGGAGVAHVHQFRLAVLGIGTVNNRLHAVARGSHKVFELAQIYLNQFFKSSKWEMNIFY